VFLPRQRQIFARQRKLIKTHGSAGRNRKRVTSSANHGPQLESHPGKQMTTIGFTVRLVYRRCLLSTTFHWSSLRDGQKNGRQHWTTLRAPKERPPIGLCRSVCVKKCIFLESVTARRGMSLVAPGKKRVSSYY
jgi:hypothetical protein